MLVARVVFESLRGHRSTAESMRLSVASSDPKLLFRLDHDYRIDETVTVGFGSRVGRIEQSYAINQKPIGVLAGC